MSVWRALIAERYSLIKPVGSGGMGRVWLARDEMLRREIAVKEVVPPDWMTPDERDLLREVTIREARAAAQLNHPNAVQIYDVVYAEGRPWIVMEYVRSRSLQEVIQQDGPLPPYRVAQIGLAVLYALRAAHQAGVLHRDVKPHNVLIAEDGRVVLTDFGLATFDGGDGAMTRAGLIMGSPQYVAPERASDGVSTVEADLWSLGATLFAAVEGHSPYARSTTMATLTALATAPPDPAPRAGPLRPVLGGLLRKDPRARLTAEEAERLLRRAATRPPGTAAARTRRLPLPRRATEQVRPEFPRGGSRRRRYVAAGAAVALAGALVTAASAWVLGPERKGGSARVAAIASGAAVPAGGAGAATRPPGTAAARTRRLPLPRRATEQVRPEFPRSGSRRRRYVAAGAAVALAGALVTAASAWVLGPERKGGPARMAAIASGAAVPAGGAGAGTGMPCGSPPTGPGESRPPAPATHRYALTDGFAWHADPTGFEVAAPATWTYFRDGDVVCFREPGGPRLLAVDTKPDLTGDPVAHWKAAEKRMTAGGTLPGYSRLAILPNRYFAGGADWDCTWTSPKGDRLRARSELFRTARNQAYTLIWVTRDLDWPGALPQLRMINASFTPAS